MSGRHAPSVHLVRRLKCLGVFPPLLKKLFFCLFTHLNVERGHSPPPAWGGLGARRIHSNGSDSPSAPTVPVTCGRQKWLSHLWKKEQSSLRLGFLEKNGQGACGGRGPVCFFTKRQNPQLQNVGSPVGKKRGGAASHAPRSLERPVHRSGRAGGRRGGSPHQPRETATETASGPPHPQDPPTFKYSRTGKEVN